jgi:hypothetical protein
MADAAQIAQQFLGAVGEKDFTGARALLHDDLDFRGPIDTFDNADDYIDALERLSQITRGADVQKVFVDGDDVCVIYDLHTAVANSPVAEWQRISGDKIAAVRVFFDARPFAALADRQGG